MLFDMVEGAGEKAAGTAGRVHDPLAEFGVDAVDHKAGNCAGGVELARVTGALQVAQDLLVNIAKEVALAAVGKVDLVKLVDHLLEQGAVFHVVEGIAERLFHHIATRVEIDIGRLVFQAVEQIVVNEIEQGITGQPFAIGRPVAPQEALGDRAAVVILLKLQLLFLGVEHFQKQQPGELAEALGIAVDTGVLAHDVLNGFDD